MSSPPRRSRPDLAAAPGPARLRRAKTSRAYSRFVGVMKWVLPVAATLVVLGVAAYPEIKKRMTGFSPFSTEFGLAQLGTPTMVGGRLEGIDRDRQRYQVRFAGATQSPSARDLVELEQPEAAIQLQEGAIISLLASTGLFDRVLEQLELFGDVRVYHDGGHEFRTDSARLDLKTDQASGDWPVTGRSRLGTLTAAGFRMTGRGEVVNFLGPAVLVLHTDELQRERRPRTEQASRPVLPPINETMRPAAAVPGGRQ